jgi:hypothetical protein
MAEYLTLLSDVGRILKSRQISALWQIQVLDMHGSGRTVKSFDTIS